MTPESKTNLNQTSKNLALYGEIKAFTDKILTRVESSICIVVTRWTPGFIFMFQSRPGWIMVSFTLPCPNNVEKHSDY